jgi:hypothetical protein
MYSLDLPEIAKMASRWSVSHRSEISYHLFCLSCKAETFDNYSVFGNCRGVLGQLVLMFDRVVTAQHADTHAAG